MTGPFDAWLDLYNNGPPDPPPGKNRKRNQLRDKRQREAWEKLCAEYGNRCLACGRDDVPLTRDHVIPRSRGGKDIISNIQPLCKPCNHAKDDQVIDYRPRWRKAALWRGLGSTPTTTGRG